MKLSPVEPYLYLVPSFIIFITFVFYPFINTIYVSMYTTDLRGRVKDFVGLQNFIDLFNSPAFYNSITITFKFVLMIAFPSVLIAFILALLANNKLKGNRIYETMFSLPMAIASAPATAFWSMAFNQTNGIINYVLGQEIQWLTNPDYALIAVSIVTVWLSIGFNFIFLTVGLRNIPTELIESVSIDGANYLQKFRYIYLPLISPQMFVVVFINVIGSFQAFGQIKLLTEGGPGDSTNVLVYSIYQEAFKYGRFEVACAQALVLFVIMLCVTLLQFKFEKKVVHYD
ncbi:MAG: glycerol-3-phosphate ABC transporter permease [Epulopiscium sp. Nuni2H_MBin001]|nr:MAG: glycerol-3-phosphate ABC transporter permease [Epulopiscium sp. Nuni2H_MBin001]